MDGLERGLGGFRGGIGASSGFFEGPYDVEGAKPRDASRDAGDPSLPPCQAALPFGGISGLLLGAQLGIATLLGAAFLFSAAFGAARLLSGLDVRRPAQLRSWLLIILCAPLGLAFYSLAALGDWRAAFGLCGLG
jgi:hypothetical protein